MDKSKKRFYIFEFIFNLLLVICVIFGQYFSFTKRSYLNATGSPLLYFTNQSNVWIGVIALVFVIFDFVVLVKNKDIEKPNYLYIIKFMCTVAITLTGVIFNFILYPQAVINNIPLLYFSLHNFFVHVIVPVLSVISYIIFDYRFRTTKFTFLFATILPIYYLCFSLILSANNVYFTKDSTVPYFFLDYKTYGWFNISSNGLGVFYWIIIVILMICIIAIIFIVIKNARAKHIVKTNKG